MDSEFLENKIILFKWSKLIILSLWTDTKWPRDRYQSINQGLVTPALKRFSLTAYILFWIKTGANPKDIKHDCIFKKIFQ